MTGRIGDLAAFRRDVARRRAAAVFDAATLRSARRTIDEVRRRGDAAVLANVRRFDHALRQLAVTREHFGLVLRQKVHEGRRPRRQEGSW